MSCARAAEIPKASAKTEIIDKHLIRMLNSPLLLGFLGSSGIETQELMQDYS
jgi:hypothetical protein